jgi:Domain of unknown function (DUF4158)
VRWLGTFLEDPLDVPGEVLDFIAGQLGMTDPSQVKRYTEREKTRFDHHWEFRRARGYREFAAEGVSFPRPYATTDEPRFALVGIWRRPVSQALACETRHRCPRPPVTAGGWARAWSRLA